MECSKLGSIPAPPQILTKGKYLSEFKTKHEKALARKNLGLEDFKEELLGDVLVNGESVVTDNIARITLPENLQSRLEALEADKIRDLINKISCSVSLSKTVFYAGFPVTINVTGTINLPAGIEASYVDIITLDGVSDSGKTSISKTGVNVDSTKTFNLSASMKAPYTKSLSSSATISKVCPIYIAIVDQDVDTAAKAIEALVKDSNLYSASSPISNLKTVTSKQFTYAANQRLAFICGQNNIGVKVPGDLANDSYTVKESTTINGMTAYVYVTGTQQAGTRTLTFNA